jgi:hypothetical protein
MIDLANAIECARACGKCHIGDAASHREVTHDLIAAGHPRLTFDLTAYVANLPRHWSQTTEARRQSETGRMWVAGAIADLDIALKAMVSRAESPQAPWPEFSEYDCYACHHSLSVPPGDRREEGLPWQSWYSTIPGRLLRASWVHAAPEVGDLLAQLNAEMSRPLPDRVRARDAGIKLDRALQSYLSESPAWKAHAEPKAVAEWLAQDLVRDPPNNWDAAERGYLALEVFGGSKDWPDFRSALDRLADELSGAPAGSSGRFNAEAVRHEFQEIAHVLQSPRR